MREIKFRAWTKEDKIMWSWKIIQENIRQTGQLPFTRDDLIIMQFTGLHDKNGKEIYEGDISQDSTHKDWITKIEWLKDEARFGGIQGNVGEIIGNIYENPELLEKKP